MTEVTQALSALEHGDPQAASRLLPLVYDELRKLVAQRMAQVRTGHKRRATVLVHEVYLRLIRYGNAGWDSRGHFFAGYYSPCRGAIGRSCCA
jgi:hypothetical protein